MCSMGTEKLLQKISLTLATGADAKVAVLVAASRGAVSVVGRTTYIVGEGIVQVGIVSAANGPG